MHQRSFSVISVFQVLSPSGVRTVHDQLVNAELMANDLRFRNATFDGAKGDYLADA